MSENNENTSEITEFFKDRISEKSNRRKLKIITQNPNEIIVDIERLDENIGEKGTKIDATTFNNIVAQIKAATKGSVVKIKDETGAYKEQDIEFDSDPQTQISNEVTARTNADNNLQSQINTKLSTNDLLNSVYPTGSIYTSVNTTSPAILFGGTWEAINGRFLLGSSSSYPLGGIGGEASHILTENEVKKI